MVEALRSWPSLTPNINLRQVDPGLFCTQLNLSPKQTARFLEHYRDEAPEDYERTLKTTNIQTINLFEASYPDLLANIPDPPLVLYCRGKVELLHTSMVAIVGSRNASIYGRSSLAKIITELAGSGLTIVSGLAYGIDGHAHAAAIKHGLGTIAVLGSGVDDDSIYPRENYKLAQQILQHSGLIISEYPPLALAMKHQFVARNRIIAGLSDATVVIEAAAKSGALLTADFAVDYNRAVFALPGPINSRLSFGPHHLLKNGAAVLTGGQDLLDELGLEAALTPPANMTSQEKLVYDYIQTTPRQIEELLEHFQLTTPELYKIITGLELQDLIIHSAPQTYIAK